MVWFISHAERAEFSFYFLIVVGNTYTCRSSQWDFLFSIKWDFFHPYIERYHKMLQTPTFHISDLISIARFHIEAELVPFILLMRFKEVEINRTIYLLCPSGGMHCIICSVIRHVRALLGMHPAQRCSFQMQSKVQSTVAIWIISVNIYAGRYGFYQLSSLKKQFEAMNASSTINRVQICGWQKLKKWKRIRQ